MYRRWLPAICLALVAHIALAQATPTEAETLRSLLSEVRQLRQALQTTMVTAQRMQITLYRLQIQALAVSQAAQRLDQARSKLAEAELERQRLTGRVEDMENLQTHTEDQRERGARDVDLRRLKKELEWRTSSEQQLQTVESDALSQVQAAQAKLSELQDDLARMDKTLASQSEP